MFIELAGKTIVSLHKIKTVSINNDLCITIRYFNNEPEVNVTYFYKISVQTDYKKINDMLTKLPSEG
jgi:hypothetical protein